MPFISMLCSHLQRRFWDRTGEDIADPTNWMAPVDLPFYVAVPWKDIASSQPVTAEHLAPQALSALWGLDCGAMADRERVLRRHMLIWTR